MTTRPPDDDNPFAPPGAQDIAEPGTDLNSRASVAALLRRIREACTDAGSMLPASELAYPPPDGPVGEAGPGKHF
jgi:hypothetical protein